MKYSNFFDNKGYFRSWEWFDTTWLTDIKGTQKRHGTARNLRNEKVISSISATQYLKLLLPSLAWKWITFLILDGLTVSREMTPLASAMRNFWSLIHSASMAGVVFQHDNWQVWNLKHFFKQVFMFHLWDHSKHWQIFRPCSTIWVNSYMLTL